MFADEPGVTVVGEAGDGLEALVVIARTDPDVVLMDLRMPGGDGFRPSASSGAAPPAGRACWC